MDQRSQALESGWGCFQTMVGNPKSLSVPADITGIVQRQAILPVWFWHAAYIAHVRPKQCDVHGSYFRGLIKNADRFNVTAIVAHVGATVGCEIDEVTDDIFHFLESEGILALLSTTKVKLAVEIAAPISDFNIEPWSFVARTVEHTNLGWCLDLAHSYAAGITWNMLWHHIRRTPPIVCHCNFPGSEHGSGKDIHGWRTAPGVVHHGKGLKRMRPEHQIDGLIWKFDETIRLLNDLNVPLIVEGSGFSESNQLTEYRKILELTT